MKDESCAFGFPTGLSDGFMMTMWYEDRWRHLWFAWRFRHGGLIGERVDMYDGHAFFHVEKALRTFA